MDWKKLDRCWFAVTLILGTIQAWLCRSEMFPDGVQYMDFADAWRNGDFQVAINTWRSPMYSWLIAACEAVVRPSWESEIVVVHILNWAIFVFAIFCMRSLLDALVDAQQKSEYGGNSGLPKGSLLAIGYSTFLFGALRFIGTGLVTPDMLVLAIFLLCCATLTRIHFAEKPAWAGYSKLGLFLALGYFTKSIFFPLSFVFLLSVVLSSGHKTRRVAGAMFSGVIFIALVSPWLVAIHWQSGRWMTSAFQPPLVWRLMRRDGVTPPEHQWKVLAAAPEVAGYITSVDKTFPYEYIAENLQPALQPGNELSNVQALLRNVSSEHFIFTHYHGVLLGLFFGLVLFSDIRKTCKKLGAYCFLLLPPLAFLAGYGLLWVEYRFMPPGYVAFFIVLLAAVHVADDGTTRRIVQAMTYGVCCVMILITLMEGGKYAWIMSKEANADVTRRVTRAMKTEGLQPGDAVAVLNIPFYQWWARPAHLKIIAGCHEPAEFWKAPSAVKKNVETIMANYGAKWLVAEYVPTAEMDQGWDDLDGTGFYILRLPSPHTK